ncbi:hypothetical protein [Alicyclobacillus mengziensis]|uniref:Uncharacterized protein n=1 Tax=Alicyclobacillus mengziensis TaxID=2931921 RepID=A0A9X7W285_9BACL|nr:hypothetical protein [Alicyclobacillus mengziensis]QSO49356.1 hypothetical protein JZ786_10770 [Alicyclobacillus mengziensis]
MTEQGAGWRKLWLLAGASIVVGLSVTGCGYTPANVTKVPPVTPGKKQYLTYQPDKYVSAPSLTQKWLKTDTTSHFVTVFLTLPANGLALNGYYNGFAEIDVPVGWKVTLSFRDENPDISGNLAVVLPHYVGQRTVSPAISGALGSSANSTTEPTTLTFTPTKTGNYVVESVPTAASGSWLWFVVTPKSETPQVKLRK